MRTFRVVVPGLAILAVLSAGCSGAKTTNTQTQAVVVTVTPPAPTVNNFNVVQFSAGVTGTSNTAVTWKVNGTTGGSQQFGFISTAGKYVAPGGSPTKALAGGSVTTEGVTVTVTAVSAANPASVGTAQVNVIPITASAQTGAVKLGTSGGNVNDSTTSGQSITCCGGTLGALVTRGGTQYILSDNHVLARSDVATPGDMIGQPGLIDNNCDRNTVSAVANLSEFFNMETDAPPKIDAALAQVVSGKVDPTGSILYLGATADSSGVPVPAPPHAGSGIVPGVGRAVAKSGRTTGLTCSTVLGVNVTTSVDYSRTCTSSAPTDFTVQYTNQVDVAGGSFTAEGDSGSLIVTQDTADPVALLFAGSDTDGVGNPVADILNFFKSGTNAVTFVGGGTHQVIGCTLPTALSIAKTAPQAAKLTTDTLAKALAARDAHAPELMGHPEVQALGVGTSYDNPKEPALVFFVTRGQPRSGIPRQVDGVRTRIIEGTLFAHRGSLSAVESADLENAAEAPQLVYEISDGEVARARVVHTAHVAELMKMPGVQGVGITSSVDSPSEAALLVSVVRGADHPLIPAVVDGLRTRVRESSRFRAGGSANQPQSGCRVPPASAKAKLAKRTATKP